MTHSLFMAMTLFGLFQATLQCQSHSDCPYTEVSPGFCVSETCVYLTGDKVKEQKFYVYENETADSQETAFDMRAKGDENNFGLSLSKDYMLITCSMFMIICMM